MTERFNIVHGFFEDYFKAKTNLMRISKKLIEPIGLSVSSWQVISQIALSSDQQRMTMAELAEDLLISRQAVQKQMKSLIDDGFIHIEENDKDKRSPYYCISPKGEELCEYLLNKIYGGWMLKSMERFSDSDIQNATKILTYLARL